MATVPEISQLIVEETLEWQKPSIRDVVCEFVDIKMAYTFDTLKEFELSGISLPTGYKRVEWLQATGTQYINTGLMIGANDVEYNFKWRETSAEVGASLCGNRNPWSGTLYHPSAGKIYAAVGNSDVQGTRTIPINSWITANFTAKNGAWSFRTNKTTLSGSYSGTVINSNYNFFLFCNSGVQEFSKYSQIPFFDLKVGGVLLRSFVACRRTSDSVAGMYDIVNDVFYANAGTGTFSIGEDVAPITPIAGDTATITDLGVTLTSNGTDWYVTSNITIPTLSQATQLFSFAKGNNGVTVTVTETGGVYKYEGDDWQLWYPITQLIVEETLEWQKPSVRDIVCECVDIELSLPLVDNLLIEWEEVISDDINTFFMFNEI